MSHAEGYRHIAEPPASPPPETGSLPRFRSQPYRPPSALRVAVIASVSLAILAAIVVLITIAAVRATGGPGGGGGGGGGGNASSLKCSAFPAFNLSELRPDPSIVRPPPPAFPVNESFVHVLLIDRLVLSSNRSARVLDEYFRTGIPQLLCTAELLRHSRSLPAGSAFHLSLSPYLVALYLSCPPSSPFYCPSVVEQQQLVNAIALGDVSFDAFPVTVETELLDLPLLQWGLQWTEQLAQETGRATGQCRTMLLTDVQGMTRALVPALNASGVSAVMLTTDERVAAIGVPPVFAWQDNGTNSSVIALYQHGLHPFPEPGDGIGLTAFNHVLLPVFTENLNSSTALTPASVVAVLTRAQSLFPSSTVLLSTLDDFVQQLCNHSVYGRVELPTVSAEVGSSSVVAAAADPLLAACYVNLLRERRRCVAEDDCDNCSRSFADFSLYLLAAAHPVLGGNVSRFLQAEADSDSPYWRWNNTDFAVCRDDDRVRELEQSWTDSRSWSIGRALQSLPADHSIVQRFRELNSSLVPPPAPDLSGLSLSPLLPGWDTGDALVSFGGDGSIVSLIHKASGVNYAASVDPLALPLYHWWAEADYNESLSAFLTCAEDDKLTGCDAATLLDYSKLGLDAAFTPPSSLPKLTCFSQTSVYVESGAEHPQQFLFNLSLPFNASALHHLAGAPAFVTLRYDFSSGAVNVTLTLYGMTSTRVPSASLLIFRPRPSSPPAQDAVEALKLGRWVREGGGASQHVVNSTLSGWAGGRLRVQGYWELALHDSIVVARTPDSLLLRLQQGRDQSGDEDGAAAAEAEEETEEVAAVLHTNVWSREHAQWFPYAGQQPEQAAERNLQFRFTFTMLR